jgi:hypothetical protein
LANLARLPAVLADFGVIGDAVAGALVADLAVVAHDRAARVALLVMVVVPMVPLVIPRMVTVAVATPPPVATTHSRAGAGGRALLAEEGGEHARERDTGHEAQHPAAGSDCREVFGEPVKVLGIQRQSSSLGIRDWS